MNPSHLHSPTHSEIKDEQGFPVYFLRTKSVEVAVVPALGAKLISLKDLCTGREWMWHPQPSLKLFQNRPGDDFALSPLAGLDECLPTIAPSTWRGRRLPDHGEVWSVPWEVDEAAWAQGALVTRVRLPLSPFEFERRISLAGSEIRMEYQLHNVGTEPESFLWALHPLIRIEAGDQLEVPSSTRSLLPDRVWTESIAAAVAEGQCAKLFLHPLREGRAAISNRATKDRLEFAWNPAQNNTLGVWLTRGAWHGHHHFAVEPTNGEPDALDAAASRKRCGLVAAEKSVFWQVSLSTNP